MAGCAIRLPDSRLSVQCRGNVIGVDMGVERVDQPQPELGDGREIAWPGGQHRIDQDRLTGLLAAKQISVGAGNRLEQLFEQHVIFRSVGNAASRRFWRGLGRAGGIGRQPSGPAQCGGLGVVSTPMPR